MNVILIDKRKKYVEVKRNEESYHLGARPLIQRDLSTENGVFLTAFGCRIFMVCESDVIVINGKQVSGPVEKTIEELFKVFN